MAATTRQARVEPVQTMGAATVGQTLLATIVQKRSEADPVAKVTWDQRERNVRTAMATLADYESQLVEKKQMREDVLAVRATVARELDKTPRANDERHSNLALSLRVLDEGYTPADVTSGHAGSLSGTPWTLKHLRAGELLLATGRYVGTCGTCGERSARAPMVWPPRLIDLDKAINELEPRIEDARAQLLRVARELETDTKVTS